MSKTEQARAMKDEELVAEEKMADEERPEG